jgi:hypothetical protein
MIPEQYWQIARRWFWIIIGLGAAGGLAGLFLLPVGLGGGTSAYDASTTLQVSRFVSFGGTVTAGTGTGGATLLADYTTSIAEKVKTVQFQARLRSALEEDGLDVTQANLSEKLAIAADRALFRINIRATASNRGDAETLAQAVADVLMEEVEAEETRIRDGLAADTDLRRSDLLSRLSDVNEERQKTLLTLDAASWQTALDDLVRRGGAGTTDLTEEFSGIVQNLAAIAGDEDLVVLNSQADELQRQLAALTQAEESFSVDLLKHGEPVFVLNPVETVATESDSRLRKRDMLVLGIGAGLIAGWVAANMAENVRNGRSSRREEEEEGEA